MTKLNDALTGLSQQLQRKNLHQSKGKVPVGLTNQDNKAFGVKPLLDSPAMNRLGGGNHNVFASKVLYQSISSSLSISFNESPEKPNQSLAKIDLAKAEQKSQESLFDFEEVAKNVMAFVSSTILSAKSRDVSNDELENMFEQARSGISQGIGEAIEVLTDAGTLTEEIQIGIDKSRDLIDSKIDELHEQVFSPPEDEEAQKIAMNLEQNIFKAQSSSIDILTAEGDKVSISFSAAQGKSLYEQSSANQSSSSYELQQSSYSKRNFSYNVEGDLNEDEKAALGKLIEDVSRIQKSFFAGDIEKAFEKAAELSIEPSQIASFSMNLTQQTSISQKYNQVANNQNDETQRESQRIAQQLIPAIDFEKQFEQLQQRAEQLLSSSNNNINNFYDAIIKADFLLKPNSTPEEQLLRWHNIVDQL